MEPAHEIWYLSHRRSAKAQASLRIRAVSPEPSLFAYMKCMEVDEVSDQISDILPHWMAAELIYGRWKVP